MKWQEVVTGGNKGVGFHVAQQLQEAGLRVVLGCRNRTLAEEAAARLGCEYEILDLGSEASIEAFAKQMEKKYKRLDVLVNNAAIAFKAADPTPFKEQALPTCATEMGEEKATTWGRDGTDFLVRPMNGLGMAKT
ncbi:unnamed protein product [Durusdinium trenchii]|uniref:Uncharacterized protein n=2 Tax=Durusdinium trenchii TaxID=1381693 RepID=A0ABP0MFS5_9DINO